MYLRMIGNRVRLEISKTAGRVILVAVSVTLLGAWARLFGQSRRSPEWTRAVETYSLGRFDEADERAAALLARDAAHTDAKRLRGTVALWRNDVKTAEVWLREVLARARGDRVGAGLLAEALVRQDRFGEAARFAALGGDRTRARMLASFGDDRPYRLAGTIGVRPLLQVDPLPLVELTVNESVTGVFLVDTGAADTVLDTTLATRLEVPTYGGERGRLFAGGVTARTERGRLASLRIGDLVVHDLPAVVMPVRSLLTTADGRPLDGIVGTSVLSRFAPVIDYGRGDLVLTSSSTATQPSCRATSVVPFWLVDDHFIVAAGSFGTLEAQPFIVDTGVGGAAVAPSDVVLRRAGIRPEAEATAVAPGGTITIRPFTVPRLALGTHVREHARGLAGVFPEALKATLRFEVAGLLGHEFFRDLRVAFDFERMEMRLCPSAAASLSLASATSLIENDATSRG